jgi:hypothetical protein
LEEKKEQKQKILWASKFSTSKIVWVVSLSRKKRGKGVWEKEKKGVWWQKKEGGGENANSTSPHTRVVWGAGVFLYRIYDWVDIVLVSWLFLFFLKLNLGRTRGHWLEAQHGSLRHVRLSTSQLDFLITTPLSFIYISKICLYIKLEKYKLKVYNIFIIAKKRKRFITFLSIHWIKLNHI